MITIFGDHGVYNHAITRESLFNDARREFWHDHSPGTAFAAASFFALHHTHKETSRLHIQLLTFVIADQCGLSAALLASTIGACNDLLHAWQILWQTLPPRMRLALPFQRIGHAFSFGFRLHFLAGHGWLAIEQLQLQVTQRFTLRAVSFDALQTQLFLKRLYLQTSPLQLTLEQGDMLLKVGAAHQGSSIIKGKAAGTNNKSTFLIENVLCGRIVPKPVPA